MAIVSFFRRLCAALLACAVLFASAPARADYDAARSPFFGPPNGDVPTAKRVVVLSLFGVAIGSLGLSVFSFLKSQSAVSEHNDQVGDCRTPEECGRLATLRHDDDAWSKRGQTYLLVGGAVGLAGVATWLLWPNASETTPKIAPAVGTDRVSIGVEGRF
jgi:hypothetical protein